MPLLDMNCAGAPGNVAGEKIRKGEKDRNGMEKRALLNGAHIKDFKFWQLPDKICSSQQI